MRRATLAGLSVAFAVTALTGCGGTRTTSAAGLTVATLRSSFKAKGLPLATPTWHHFGPVKRVEYLDWSRPGRVTTTPAATLSVGTPFAFTVLVFKTAAEARSALNVTRRYLQRAHTPAIQRENVILAARTPIAPTNVLVWKRAKTALRTA